MSESLHEAAAEVAERFPAGAHSPLIPVLRLAQERYGWLPPEALREVAAAVGVTPAICLAVASFYDMFHLEPVGRHLVEVCTNLSCALAGAQQVLEAFEDALAIPVGATTPDGAVTLRPVECLGGCGYATVVALDHRYRHDVGVADVAAIVRELRAGA